MSVKENMSCCPQVLVVDDDENVGISLVDGLSVEGLDATLATTADKALSLVQERKFDVAVLDMFMPDKTGIDLGRQLQTEIPGLAIIILTGHPSVDVCRDSFLAGAVNFVTKGEPLEKLMNVIVEALYPIASDTTLAHHAQRLGLPSNHVEQRLLDPLSLPLDSFKHLAIEYYLTNLASLCNYDPLQMSNLAGCSTSSMYRLMSRYRVPTPRNVPSECLDS